MLCQPAYAADDFAGPWERFSVSLGGFGALSSSDVRVGTNVLGAGLDIDVEDALGMSTSQKSAPIRPKPRMPAANAPSRLMRYIPSGAHVRIAPTVLLPARGKVVLRILPGFHPWRRFFEGSGACGELQTSQ